MDGIVEIEEVEGLDSIGVPTTPLDPNSSINGVFFYKLLIAVGLFFLYLFVSRVGGYLASKFVKRVNTADQSHHDEAMKEVRRRLQERFDNELKKRQSQNKSGNQPNNPETSNEEKPQQNSPPESPIKRVKAPKLGCPNTSDFFPLMGDTSHGVCYRRPRGGRSGGR